MAELISLFAFLLTGSLVWLLIGPPVIDRAADLAALDELEARRG